MLKKPVHLVKNYHDVTPKKREHTLLASEKIDGVFMFGRKGVGYSRTGKQYLSLKEAAEGMAAILPNHVVIAEWVTMDEDGLHPVNIISGNQRRDEVYKGRWAGIIHDVIPLADFDAGFCDIPFRDRIEMAAALYGDKFLMNPQKVLNGQEVHEAYAANIIRNGGEGAVFKQPMGTWTAGKKNEVQMKIKCGVSYDLECIGIELGRTGTKYEGLFGKLVYRWTRGRTVSARGRINEKQGAMYLADPTTCIGKIFQVDGMCLTPDGMIREPVTIMERVDKDEADV